MTDEFQQVEYIVRDLSIDAPQKDRIPATVLVRVAPREKKVGDAARLAFFTLPAYLRLVEFLTWGTWGSGALAFY
jgi:hypothetical protein